MMKSAFPGYYRLSEEEFAKLWNECIFTLDANVMLNLYQYLESTRVGMIEILDKISARLWITHQAAMEFQENRLNRMYERRKEYENLIDLLAKTEAKLDDTLKPYSRYPLSGHEALVKQTRNKCEKLTKAIEPLCQPFDPSSKDEIQDTLTSLLENRVGAAYSKEELIKIFKTGEERYSRKIPPGFKDVEKEGEKRFGDLILWLQIIDQAKTTQKSIILITDETKEDWWWSFEGKTIGPRPELIQEFLIETKGRFYMYRPDRFMEFAGRYLKQSVEQKAINEIREFQKQEKLDMLKKLVMEQDDMLKRYDYLKNKRTETEITRNQLEESFRMFWPRIRKLQTAETAKDSAELREIEEIYKGLQMEKVRIDEDYVSLNKEMDLLVPAIEEAKRKNILYRNMLAKEEDIQ